MRNALEFLNILVKSHINPKYVTVQEEELKIERVQFTVAGKTYVMSFVNDELSHIMNKEEKKEQEN